MKNFFSSKNPLTIILLWGIVVSMAVMLGYTFSIGELPMAPFIILGLTVILILWVLLDTRYVLRDGFLFYRSGPFRGRIDIAKIKKIQRHSGLYVPVTMKPALDTKGFIITYNNFDDVFVSPQHSDIFLQEIQKINPGVQIL